MNNRVKSKGMQGKDMHFCLAQTGNVFINISYKNFCFKHLLVLVSDATFSEVTNEKKKCVKGGMAFALFIPSYLHICRVTERKEYIKTVIWPFSTQSTLSHRSPSLLERKVEENRKDQRKGSLRSC